MDGPINNKLGGVYMCTPHHRIVPGSSTYVLVRHLFALLRTYSYLVRYTHACDNATRVQPVRVLEYNVTRNASLIYPIVSLSVKKVAAHALAFSYWVLRISTDKKRLEMRFKEE